MALTGRKRVSRKSRVEGSAGVVVESGVVVTVATDAVREPVEDSRVVPVTRPGSGLAKVLERRRARGERC